MCCALAGCRTTQPSVPTQKALAGSYVYKSENPEGRATDHELDHLVLHSDGRYDLVQGGSTKAVSEKKGTWRIVPGAPPNVLLDNAGYPIQIKRNEIRLLIDDDVGIWYAKTK